MSASADLTETVPAAGRRVIIGSFAVALLIAAYTGLRLPNAWSATLQSVSLFEGFHKRFLIGTLLHPLAVLVGYHYRLFGAFSFAVLGAVVAVAGVAVVRARSAPQQLLIIAWLVLVGGFLFDEVGYFEQVLYLVLFASIYLVNRGHVPAAILAMSCTPFVHEQAILTVIPLFGLVLLRGLPFRAALIATAIPALVNGVVLLLPPASPDVIAQLSGVLQHASFHYRPDALDLFSNTQAQAWQLYDVCEQIEAVWPATLALITLFALAWQCDRGRWRSPRDAQSENVVLVASAAAIAIPALLVFGGWDSNRWLFLVICNFVCVVWLALAIRPTRAVDPRTLSLLVVALLVIGRVPLYYFDRVSPRELTYTGVHNFAKSVARGRAFRVR